jgi:hypothetical protein
MAVIVPALTLIVAFLGAFVGSWLAGRARKRTNPASAGPAIDPVTASEIDRVAAGWAAAAGEPAAEALLAEKLRMAFRLRSQRPPCDQSQGRW